MGFKIQFEIFSLLNSTTGQFTLLFEIKNLFRYW